MTWHDTAERIRILREVEASAAVDPSGQLPWRPSWAPCFGDPAGLLVALRDRWERMCVVRLEDLTTPQQVRDAQRRLRRSHAGVLRILAAHGLVGVATRPPGPPLEVA
jgi:hypothetical protein